LAEGSGWNDAPCKGTIRGLGLASRHGAGRYSNSLFAYGSNGMMQGPQFSFFAPNLFSETDFPKIPTN